MKSPLSTDRWSRSAWALAFAATLVLVVAVVIPPFLLPAWRAPLMQGFQMLCHQLPERSFAIDGVSLAACHRCTGIYVGLVLGILVAPVVRADWIERQRLEALVLLVAVVPAALDWSGQALGLWANTVALRVATGLWFGLLAGGLLGRAVTTSTPRAPAGKFGAGT